MNVNCLLICLLVCLSRLFIYLFIICYKFNHLASEESPIVTAKVISSKKEKERRIDESDSDIGSNVYLFVYLYFTYLMKLIHDYLACEESSVSTAGMVSPRKRMVSSKEKEKRKGMDIWDKDTESTYLLICLFIYVYLLAINLT